MYGVTDDPEFNTSSSFRKADVNARAADGSPALYHASVSGHMNCVDLLISIGADIEARRFDGDSPLIGAANAGQDSIVEELLKLGSNVSGVNVLGFNALHAGALEGQGAVVDVILNWVNESDEMVNSRDADGSTPLLLAATNGHLSVVRRLAEAGGAVDSKNDFQESPMWMAALYGEADLVRLLLRFGADPNILGPQLTELHFQALQVPETSDEPLSATLADEAPDYLKIANELVAEAIHGGSSNGLVTESEKKLMGHRPEVQAAMGAATAFRAVSEDYPYNLEDDDLEYDYGVVLRSSDTTDPDSAEAFTTPLMVAAMAGDDPVAEALMSSNLTRVDEADLGGATALHHAAAGGHTVLVDRLVMAGAKMDAVTSQGATPVVGACVAGWDGVVDILLSEDNNSTGYDVL